MRALWRNATQHRVRKVERGPGPDTGGLVIADVRGKEGSEGGGEALPAPQDQLFTALGVHIGVAAGAACGPEHLFAVRDIGNEPRDQVGIDRTRTGCGPEKTKTKHRKKGKGNEDTAHWTTPDVAGRIRLAGCAPGRYDQSALR